MSTEFPRELIGAADSNNVNTAVYLPSALMNDCESSPHSISVQTKQQRPPQSVSDNCQQQQPNVNGENTDEDDDEYDYDEAGEEDEEDDDHNNMHDDDDHEGVDLDDNEDEGSQSDMLTQFNDDPSSMHANDNLQECIDALGSVIEQVPSYLDQIYNEYTSNGDGISQDTATTTNNTKTNSVNNDTNHSTDHLSAMVNDSNNTNTSSGMAFDHHTLYNYSALDCFIVHPELIHPQIHDPILHHHTSSTSSYSFLASLAAVAPNVIEHIMDSVDDQVDDGGNNDRKHLDRYFCYNRYAGPVCASLDGFMQLISCVF